MSSPLLLITGASGYLGAHIVQEALRENYRVRLTARPGKVDALRQQFKENKSVEVEAIADLVEGDYSNALRGVDAVIHTASPLAGREAPEDMIKHAVEGALNLVRQAAKAGTKRAILTSSIAAVNDVFNQDEIYSDAILTHNNWNPVTREIALTPGTDDLTVYCATKTVSEQEIWKFADEHPEIDITTINPPFLYGPLPQNIRLASKKALSELSSLSLFYTNVLQEPNAGGILSFPQFPCPAALDVRDAARAHILALKGPLSKEVGRKRILIEGPKFTWLDATEHLKLTHPGLVEEGRLKDATAVKHAKDLKILKYDNGRAESVLGWKEFIPWEKTVDDMTDSILQAEKALPPA